MATADTYPVTYDVEYPDRELDRVSSFFRLITVIPIAIVLASVSGGSSGGWGNRGGATLAMAGGFLVLGPLLMLLFREKYPRWWFDFNQELARFTARVSVYLSLMDDRYPSTDEEQAVHLDFPYPDAANGLNRWLPLVKWFLAIPHWILLGFLYLGAIVAVILAWFAILFTGRYPRGLFDYVEGVARWQNRVVGYAVVLVTDDYPPFRLRA
jgi:hypothetical protein